jgi:hypothetical protein
MEWSCADGLPLRGNAPMKTALHEMVGAHEAASKADVARLRTLSVRERSVLIELACESAAVTNHSRLAAGLPAVEPAPWPPSTWEFLRKHAAHVRT